MMAYLPPQEEVESRIPKFGPSRALVHCEQDPGTHQGKASVSIGLPIQNRKPGRDDARQGAALRRLTHPALPVFSSSAPSAQTLPASKYSTFTMGVTRP